MNKPFNMDDGKCAFDRFGDGQVFEGKRKGRLPAMGWNSWNAFGSGNTEELTKITADRITELGLDILGYSYVVLDDGCYKPERENGLLANEEIKFPSGFRALSDYIHSKGLKFGMYNDIGTNLCAGAAVGTCGHEKDDARSYIDWGVDFIKVDNCYYPWDNATFSNAENARFTYAPRIRSVIVAGEGFSKEYSAEKDCRITGNGIVIRDGYAENIGTFDGTGPDVSPVGPMSGELVLDVNAPAEGEYTVKVLYASSKESGIGEWLQIADDKGCMFYDDLLPETTDKDTFRWSDEIKITLKQGENMLRLMNHRRQENTLHSYAELLKYFYETDKDFDILLSICEWGKTQPQNWGYKVGDSWRILNDITFQVGSDGDPGQAAWTSDYTTSVTSQYNKAVIMDEFAGLDKGWNDPDMMMIGMNGLDLTMCRTHFAMWCMMNSPLMLGLDLRRVEKGDDIHTIISNKDLIALNQDALGIQAKRVFSSKASGAPDKEYIRDNDRIDILAKPLSDGALAVSFINLSGSDMSDEISADLQNIASFLGDRMPAGLKDAETIVLKDLWTGEEKTICGRTICIKGICAHDNITFRVSAV